MDGRDLEHHLWGYGYGYGLWKGGTSVHRSHVRFFLCSVAHYEWEVVFSPGDVDMNTVRAVFEANGQLKIHVRRQMIMRDREFPPPLVYSRS